eukprot:7150412-Pyramimonas_sp.AAC.1
MPNPAILGSDHPPRAVMLKCCIVSTFALQGGRDKIKHMRLYRNSKGYAHGAPLSDNADVWPSL